MFGNSLPVVLSSLLVVPFVLGGPLQAQIPLQSSKKANFDFKHHLAGISPYHAAGGQVNQPPEGCEVVTAIYLVRHTAITANDDEW